MVGRLARVVARWRAGAYRGAWAARRRVPTMDPGDGMYLKDILGEVTGDGSHVPRYTWAGKGWGGALLDDDGEALGFDCSGFACGLLWRLGIISAKEATNTDGLLAGGRRVSLSSARPFDLLLFGDDDPPGDASHVGVMLKPGVQVVYMDAGGGGSKTRPGGSDWPPSRGRVRLVRHPARSDLISCVRFRGSPTSEDREALAEWSGHVAQVRAGFQPDLPRELMAWPYQLRPMWRGYGGGGGMV